MWDWNIPEYQELEDFAWDRMEVDDLRGATDAALRAIKLEPDTIDSYVILAQAAAVLGQKQAYAREAVRLGEIASAPSEDFPFWSVARTRPYMRGLHNGQHKRKINAGRWLATTSPCQPQGFAQEGRGRYGAPRT
jgi:hypothetical protein